MLDRAEPSLAEERACLIAELIRAGLRSVELSIAAVTLAELSRAELA